VTTRPADSLGQDDGPLEQRAHDAESAYPNNDQPAGAADTQEESA
jgi:hypothetical protein